MTYELNHCGGICTGVISVFASVKFSDLLVYWSKYSN